MLISSIRPVKNTALKNLTSAHRVFSSTGIPETVSHTKTPTSVPRSVFRKLSAPFEFTLRPKLISHRQLHRLFLSHVPVTTPRTLRKKIPVLVVTVASPSPPASGAVPKRKRLTGEMKYYAVRKGYNPGIYTTWKECLGQVTGFKGATFKSFASEADAKSFMEGNDPTLDPDSSVYVAKWYGVRSGKCPGVYSTWKAAQEQVVGVQKPKVKAFATREEAEAFVASGPGVPSSPLPEDRKTRASKDMTTTRRDTVVPTTTAASKKRRTAISESVADAESISGETVSDGMLEEESSGDSAVRQLEEEHAIDEGTDGHRAKKQKSSKPAVPKKTTVLKIYTDGSTMGNGREEAIGGVGVWFGSNDVRNVSEPLTGTRQTNQRAELSAIKRALEIAPRHREVQIFSDSQYAINCVTLWHHNWSRNNWLTTLGKKVENQDLIEEILEKMQEREDIGAKTGFEWVKGHTSAADGNSQADRLAVEGARKARAMNGGTVLRR